MQALITEGQYALTHAGLGRWGRQGAENLSRVIQDEIRALQDLEKLREQRATVIAGMTLPEFQMGGLVSTPRGILALLHPGEFVMRQAAVDALGENFLARLNRTPQFAAGGAVGDLTSVGPQMPPRTEVHFHIETFDGPSFETWLRRNQYRIQGTISKVVRRAVMDGQL